MGYKVDFDSLDSMYNSIGSQANNWIEELEAVKGKMQVLLDSSNMSGQTADNLKLYVESVHMTIIGLLSQLVSLHSTNCLLYKSDYQTNIDTELHAVIKSSELKDYRKRIKTNRQDAIDVNDAVEYVLKGIKDIFYVSYKDVSNVDAAHRTVETFLNDLDEEIKQLEKNHSSNDFTNSTQMIETLTTFIKEQKAQARSYITDFSTDKLSSSSTFYQLYTTHVDINKEFEEKASSIETAVENENQRVAELQEEYEERQKKANIINWVVTGVCIVGSIAAIALTGGAATPLVVGGISAVSGAVIAGTSNLTSQYVEHGNIIENADEIDWGSFGKDVVVAGVTGFVTGAVGASVGNAVSTGLKTTSLGSSLLNSTNSLTRIGTGAVIGSISEVSSGIVSRGAGTLIATGNLKEAASDAFDGKSILADAALGGADGAVEQISSIKQAQKAADKVTSDYNKRYDPLEAGEANGLENLKSTKNGGVDFSESDYILRTESGEPIQVKIKSTGNRNKDYELAEQILKEEYGIDIDFKSMRKGQHKTHVWHHMDDYNVMTNETTMQFIEIDAHKKIRNHSGSANQYYTAHGHGYSKQEFDTNYEGFSFLDYASPIINNVSQTMENLTAINSQKLEFVEFNFS